MIIARIIGTVVASQKDERLEGKKLLIVRPINIDGSDTSGYVVAVDTVGAGFHERVLVVAGSSARLCSLLPSAAWVKNLGHARRPASVGVRIVGIGRAFEPIAFVVMTERLFRGTHV